MLALVDSPNWGLILAVKAGNMYIAMLDQTRVWMTMVEMMGGAKGELMGRIRRNRC